MANDLPLAEIRVVDTTRFPTGAYCTQLLASLGAEVWRIDGPDWDPAMMGIGSGLSRGKRSVTVDLRHPQGHDVLRRLAGVADALLENERPGAMDERGFGPTHAARETPRLIWCSLTGFGQDGPYADWPGHDITYIAHSGLMTALHPELPWYPQAVLAVPLGAIMAATGIIGALLEREHTGRGTQLDISLAESATWLLSGVDPEINGTPWGIPYGPERRLYKCADDRYVTVAAGEPRTWAALCTGLGLDDLADNRPGGNDRDEAGRRLEEVFATKPAAQWVAELGPQRAAVGAVNRGTDLKDDPHVQARGAPVEVDGVHVPAVPVRFRDDGVPREVGQPIGSPTPGGDTDAVLTAAGLSDEEIEAFRAAGAVG